jgi:hypothetical protein
MNFFFVRDHRHRLRFFSAEPLAPLPVKFSKSREVWETAKRKIIDLNPRTLLQEQAFEHGGRPGEGVLRILHSGHADAQAVQTKFFFFLQRQRTRHILVLAGEALLLPASGLAALLPGPNIFFYALAILMVLQWQALRGITRLLHKDLEFIADPLLAEWEAAVNARDEGRFPGILERLEKVHGLAAARRVLCKGVKP